LALIPIVEIAIEGFISSGPVETQVPRRVYIAIHGPGSKKIVHHCHKEVYIYINKRGVSNARTLMVSQYFHS